MKLGEGVVLAARFPSLTLCFMALNLPFMPIIKVLLHCNTGKRCRVDRWKVIYDHHGRGAEQAYEKLSTFLIEQVTPKEVLDDAKPEEELLNM